MQQRSTARHHAEWLSLIEVSGPFLSLPVLMKAFPQELDADDPDQARDLRLAFEEWQDNQLGARPRPEVHTAWIDFVLRHTLELPDEVIAEGQDIPQSLKATVSEHGETLRPDIVVRNPDDAPDAGKPRLLVQTYPLSQDLTKPVPDRRWKAAPDTRMMELLHATDVRLGLVTNGERWMLVDAPRGETTGYASWYASLWLEERLTLRALRSLLGPRRFFAVTADETLEAMLAESARNQQEVTDQLGYQVRSAVEVLIQSLDRADQDRGRQLLADVPETVLYEAALTVMMRLVFLFCAEERELLLLGDPLYDEHYAVSTLSDQLQDVADQHGEEVLERRRDAWCRLLSTFRAVYGGVHHERMTLLAYAGSLFDPDRFPFLEGRPTGTSWRDTPANPLPVDNRTVLHLLRSLQYLEMRVPGGGAAESRRLSFRALDIEQIGHVYEGLLDHTAKRATAPILGLQGTKSKEPEVPLGELERLREQGEDELVDFLRQETGRSASALKKRLEPTLEGEQAGRLLAVCGTDSDLGDRVQPFAGLLRDDSFGYPVVIGEGSVYVTAGTDRRSSGTHYTPRSLTEPIVQYTLEPSVYVGPAEGKPKEEWQLKPAEELLDLKICDMACGSGAFLVQACRYLSERVVEAWEEAESRHPDVPGITPFGKPSSGESGEAIIPKDTDERMAYAQRLVAQRCLYGVDKNPLAVEMAKLSLWLLTLSKDKPFTFLDHAIRPGDSLVGIKDLKQLEAFNLDGEGTSNRVILYFLRDRVRDAIDLRRRIADRPADKPEDVAAQEELMRQAEEKIERLKCAADFLVSAAFAGTSANEREAALTDAAIKVAARFENSEIGEFRSAADAALDGQPTFHWPLEFPEVLVGRGGFDAMVCNPPFMGGKKITGALGSAYRDHIVAHVAGGTKGVADLCAYFFLRADGLLSHRGGLGYLGTNTIGQGDTAEVGLEQIRQGGSTIIRAEPSRTWPGTAGVVVAAVWTTRQTWSAPCVLANDHVPGISAILAPSYGGYDKPQPLAANAERCGQGVIISGSGFVLTPDEASGIIDSEPFCQEVIFPYIGGKELNERPDLSHARYVIDFGDWPLEKAKEYGQCYERVRALVYPQRSQHKRKAYRERWWQYAERQASLLARTSSLSRVLVKAKTSRTWAFAFIPPEVIYSTAIIGFVSELFADFGVLQSLIHNAWAERYTSTLKTDMAYIPTDCFENFPFPEGTGDVASAAEDYYEHRCGLMLDRHEGLTQTYSRVDYAAEGSADVATLRDLQTELDAAAVAAYGWTDLDLGHGFHETKQGLRFTISEEARREVLDRLLQLNHERYEEEVRQGLHDKKKSKRKTPKRRTTKNAPTSADLKLIE